MRDLSQKCTPREYSVASWFTLKIDANYKCLVEVHKENIHKILIFVRCKNREKIYYKENNHIKQYLRNLTICLHSWSYKKEFHHSLEKKNTRYSITIFFLTQHTKL